MLYFNTPFSPTFPRLFAITQYSSLCFYFLSLPAFNSHCGRHPRKLQLVEEAVVVPSPKETKQLRRQPLSVSLLDASQLSQRGIQSVGGLTSYVPNFHLPDYGSRITSACYIRGIGSRINTPAVGDYVDDVPYMDKSAYDFRFLDINRVDVLRGPQGTLYGRNTMGGLIRVFTADDQPSRHGHQYRLDIAHCWAEEWLQPPTSHPVDRMGLSIGGYYEGENGFYTNTHTREKNKMVPKVPVANCAGLGVRLMLSNWTGQTSYDCGDEDVPLTYFLTQTQAGNSSTALPKETLEQSRPTTAAVTFSTRVWALNIVYLTLFFPLSRPTNI